jgi:uncharacterized protein (DUF1697 family)
MAVNSKREQIITYIVTKLEELKTINFVVRKMPTVSDLKQFALPQFPVAAVVGRLPVPIEKKSGRKTGDVEIVKSSFAVDLFVYIQDNENPDSSISNLADDIWVKLYSDQTKSGLVLGTTLEITEGTEYWAPFVAFKMTDKSIYIHDTGGI